MREEDFTEKRAIIIAPKLVHQQDRAYSPFEIVLKSNPHLSVFTHEDRDRNFREVSPGRRGLLLTSSWEFIELGIWRRIWEYFPTKWSRGIVLLGKQSPLMRETACQLARKGFSLKVLPDIKFNNEMLLSEEQIVQIKLILKNVMESFFKGDIIEQ